MSYILSPHSKLISLVTSLVASFLMLLPALSYAARGESPTGGYFALRSGLSDGSTKFQNVNSTITGTPGQIELGYRPWSFLKFGVFGLYETLLLKQNSLTVGRVDMIGYGGAVRIFPLAWIFFEAGGGNTQARYEETVTRAQLIADGSVLYTGPGLEFNFGKSGVAIEFALRSRTVTFFKNEFQNMRSTLLMGGLDFYF